MRHFGLEGYRSVYREQLRWTRKLAEKIDEHPDFERVAPTLFSLVCLRFRPPAFEDEHLDAVNEKLLEAVNATGEFFLSATRVNGRYTIRVAIGNLLTKERHVARLWEVLRDKAAELWSPVE